MLLKSVMKRTIFCTKLTTDGFADFGDVIEVGESPMTINEGMCQRHHDLARLSFATSGQVGISLFDAEIRALPYEFSLMERHPLGSQAFLPMGMSTLLVIVAPDNNGRPGQPLAFESSPFQGVNIRRGVWHGVLTPMSGQGLFAVVDWVGEANNLDIHQFEQSFCVERID